MSKIEIIESLPPNYEDIIKAIPAVKDIENVVFTYGSKIYNPDKGHVPDHLMVHESVHTRQQGEDPDVWWYRYLKDIEFRFEQELEAYSIQYAFILKTIKDRNIQSKLLFGLAQDLKSPLYGMDMSHGEGESKIRNGAKKFM